jgi:hypothetical protein
MHVTKYFSSNTRIVIDQESKAMSATLEGPKYVANKPGSGGQSG